jgi:hypothetical protein
MKCHQLAINSLPKLCKYGGVCSLHRGGLFVIEDNTLVNLPQKLHMLYNIKIGQQVIVEPFDSASKVKGTIVFVMTPPKEQNENLDDPFLEENPNRLMANDSD